MELLFTRFVAVSIGLAPLIGLLLLLMPLLGKRYAASLNSWIWLAVAARLLLPLQLEKPVVLELPLPQAQPSEAVSRLDAELPSERRWAFTGTFLSISPPRRTARCWWDCCAPGSTCRKSL